MVCLSGDGDRVGRLVETPALPLPSRLFFVAPLPGEGAQEHNPAQALSRSGIGRWRRRGLPRLQRGKFLWGWQSLQPSEQVEGLAVRCKRPCTGFPLTATISASMPWRIGERVNAQFRTEFFNIFNHPSFALPTVSWSLPILELSSK